MSPFYYLTMVSIIVFFGNNSSTSEWPYPLSLYEGCDLWGYFMVLNQITKCYFSCLDTWSTVYPLYYTCPHKQHPLHLPLCLLRQHPPPPYVSNGMQAKRMVAVPSLAMWWSITRPQIWFLIWDAGGQTQCLLHDSAWPHSLHWVQCEGKGRECSGSQCPQCNHENKDWGWVDWDIIPGAVHCLYYYQTD